MVGVSWPWWGTSSLSDTPWATSSAAWRCLPGRSLVADDAARKADRGRREGCFAREIRDLPDGGGGCGAVALPGHPRTHWPARAAGFGAGMTAARDEMAETPRRPRGRPVRIGPKRLSEGRFMQPVAVAICKNPRSRQSPILTRHSRSIVISESVREDRELETIWEIPAY